MANHIPDPLTDEQLKYLESLSVHTDIGIVCKDGKELGSIDKDSRYVRINTNLRTFKRSHIIWWKYTGEWPTTLIDHENLIRNDDRIENLRSKTSRENAINSKRSLERDLPPGVYRAREDKKSKFYQARIWLNPDNYNLGFYDTVEEALEVVQQAHVDLAERGREFFIPKVKVVKDLPEGVRRHPPNKKNPFKSKIWVNGKDRHLGYFPTAEAASEAFQKAKAERDGTSPVKPVY